MPYSNKSKRSRNMTDSCPAAPTPLCGLCQPVDEPKVHHQSRSPTKTNECGHLPKTVSACTAATAATNTSSQSMSSSDFSALEREICPVTGVYAKISDDYYISPEVIGKGHYGVVRECVHRATRQSFAVKSIDKSKIGRLDHLQREIFLLANIDHHGIMKMVDCYEDAQCVHIVTEKYTGGELFDKIVDSTSSRGCLSERKTGAIIKSLLEAVAYLHDNGVVHRDIKPENILFESEDEKVIKLIDFGLSRRHERGEAPMSNSVGTAYYMSPELLKGRYDKSCDMWSVGTIVYILLCGYPPFNSDTDPEIFEKIRKGHFEFPAQQWSAKSDEVKDFVKCLLRRDPGKRFTAKEALVHPWIKNLGMKQPRKAARGRQAQPNLRYLKIP
mmetsp:Transcript_9688/g.21023  ORF Transcript_9688/g.21023 Transcript_9688/m.21023 type:complete len:386 (+) Transcript_9688:113-1270(+)